MNIVHGLRTFCLLLLLGSPAIVIADQPSQQRQQELMHLLKQDCGSCHGMTLKGGLGPALTVDAIADQSVADLVYTITYGREALAMPSWKNILTNDEILWLSEQLKSGIE